MRSLICREWNPNDLDKDKTDTSSWMAALIVSGSYEDTCRVPLLRVLRITWYLYWSFFTLTGLGVEGNNTSLLNPSFRSQPNRTGRWYLLSEGPGWWLWYSIFLTIPLFLLWYNACVRVYNDEIKFLSQTKQAHKGGNVGIGGGDY